MKYPSFRQKKLGLRVPQKPEREKRFCRQDKERDPNVCNLRNPPPSKHTTIESIWNLPIDVGDTISRIIVLNQMWDGKGQHKTNNLRKFLDWYRDGSCFEDTIINLMGQMSHTHKPSNLALAHRPPPQMLRSSALVPYCSMKFYDGRDNFCIADFPLSHFDAWHKAKCQGARFLNKWKDWDDETQKVRWFQLWNDLAPTLGQWVMCPVRSIWKTKIQSGYSHYSQEVKGDQNKANYSLLFSGFWIEDKKVPVVPNTNLLPDREQAGGVRGRPSVYIPLVSMGGKGDPCYPEWCDYNVRHGSQDQMGMCSMRVAYNTFYCGR